ncbi:MAG: nucleoside-triphosphatase [Halanaerobiales bacterium]|nr:nucleoside-triphosphatase [Halanaerobiales bacterium]
MPNNIVITGEKYVGKSTIVRKLIEKLNLKAGGFVVGRNGSFNQWLSFYLSDPLAYYEHQTKENVNFKENCQIFAKRDNVEAEWDIRPDVFDTLGVKLLENGLQNRDIVIMDELGRFELKANKFQQKVFEILDSPNPVIAVLKDEHNKFLDKVRSREDVDIYRIKKNNNDIIFNKTYKKLEKIINNKNKE